MNVRDLKTTQLPEMEHMLGAHVCVTNARTGQKVCGILKFVGYLHYFPTWGLVCTIDRLPGVHINSVADITLYVPKMKIINDKK